MAEEKAADGSAGPAPQPVPRRRQQQLSAPQQSAARLRGRNRWTGLCFGAFALGLFGYTILSVQQERVVEDLDQEVRVQSFRGPRTGANS